MCGIIGAIGSDIGPQILKGLQRLEYRGYDSFGLSLSDGFDNMPLVRRVGAPSAYRYEDFTLEAKHTIGIGHTRWATHGGVCEENAHPHRHLSRIGLISLVHNGVVENITDLQKMLDASYEQRLLSQTDTEVILMHLVQKIDREGFNLPQALAEVLMMISGSFSLLIMEHASQTLWGVKQDLPLYFIPAKEQRWLVSDLQALTQPPEQAHLLEDRRIFALSLQQEGYDPGSPLTFFKPLPEAMTPEESGAPESELLFVEIAQQPGAIAKLLSRDFLRLSDAISEYHLIACGSSYHAALVAAQLIEPLILKPIRVFIASEFRDSTVAQSEHSALIALSQSGETADLLAALREQGHRYRHVIGVCNRQGALLSTLVQHCYFLDVGVERSVASTKAFTAQVALLYQVLLPEKNEVVDGWHNAAQDVIAKGLWHSWARELTHFKALMILGRGPLWALAQEGALKMKELTYCHVHALPIGELKHGSLALIDHQCPVLVLLPADRLMKKNLIAVHEVVARSGLLFIIAEQGVPLSELPQRAHIAQIPSLSSQLLQTLLFTLPLQLLAGYWAKELGLNVDKPRHLAKSVTVE